MNQTNDKHMEARAERVKRIILESLIFTNENSEPWAKSLAENILDELDKVREESVEWVYRVEGDYYTYDDIDVLHLDWTNPDVKILRKPVPPWESMPERGM